MVYLYKLRPDLYKLVELYGNRINAPDIRPDPADDGEKTADNIRRAYRTIEELALCNDFAWFGTFTLDPKKYNRTDLPKFRKDLTQFFRDVKKKTGSKIGYLIVPELHRDRKGWHMHGLLSGITPDQLRAFTLKEKLPQYLRNKIKGGEPIFDWPAYRARFGWVDLEPIKSQDGAARYLAKYITKGVRATPDIMSLHDHLYFCSQGLKRPELILTDPQPLLAKGKAASSPLAALPSGRLEFSHEWDYGQVLWYRSRTV